MTGFDTITIGELLERNIITGLQDGNHGEIHPTSADYTPDGIPFVMASDLTGDQVDLENCKYISEATAEGLRKGFAIEGDVLLTHKGTLGLTDVVGPICTPYIVLTPQVTYYRPNPEELDKHFLKYVFISPFFQGQLLAFTRGGTRPYIGITAQRELRVVFPSFKTQQGISVCLRAYDDLIAANQRRIKLLEESARLLYREWFVLLRFPGHEAVPVTDGVPERWERKPVSEMIDANPKTPFPKDVSRPFVGMEALSEDSMIIDVSDARHISGGAKFRNGDTLLARITPCLENGKTGFVQFLEDGEAAASGSTEFIVLRSRTVNPYWIYCLARSDSFREHAVNSMAGSDGRQRVNSKCFDKYLTLQPPSDVLQTFEENVSEMFAQVQSLTEYNRALRQARDMLLPKLMSGALDVSRIAVPKEVEA